MPVDPGFRMTVEDVFAIRGRGTVVTGQIEGGTIAEGDTVEVRGELFWGSVIVTGVEIFQKRVDRAGAGDIVGILLRGVDKGQLRSGDVLAGAERELEPE